MTGIRTLLSNLYVQIVIQVILTFVGFIMIALQVNNLYFDMGDNPWNARLYGVLGSTLISAGASMVGTNLINKLKRFVITLGILLTCWMIVGGFFVLNDASAGTNISGGNVWVAFDVMSRERASAGKIIRNGVYLALIAGALITAIYFFFKFKDRNAKISGIVLAVCGFVVILFYGLMYT